MTLQAQRQVAVAIATGLAVTACFSPQHLAISHNQLGSADMGQLSVVLTSRRPVFSPSDLPPIIFICCVIPGSSVFAPELYQSLLNRSGSVSSLSSCFGFLEFMDFLLFPFGAVRGYPVAFSELLSASHPSVFFSIKL